MHTTYYIRYTKYTKWASAPDPALEPVYEGPRKDEAVEVRQRSRGAQNGVQPLFLEVVMHVGG